jgi:hypothetical protein
MKLVSFINDLHIGGGLSLSKPWVTSAPKVVHNNENQYNTNFLVSFIKNDTKIYIHVSTEQMLNLLISRY